MKTKGLRIAIIGATGAVGQELIQLMESDAFPIQQLKLFASNRSAGKQVSFRNESLVVEALTDKSFDGLGYAIFCAGSEISRQYAPLAVDKGCVVIDNSSAFRMQVDVPLIVPEINGSILTKQHRLIANPNCSTAIALMALYPLHREFGLKRFFASTYQAVSGTGQAAIEELTEQTTAWANGIQADPSVYKHPIAFNLIPQVDSFTDNGYTREELKLQEESRKILGLPELRVSATCVRVPVFRAHSIAISAEFEEPISLEKAKKCLSSFEGLDLLDEPTEQLYPMPLTIANHLNCAVGRLRLDLAFTNGLSLWVVGDQLLKGAALNAFQILKKLL